MSIWDFILSKLNSNQSVYLLTVLYHKGSSPGRQGFKMAVAKDHALYGSIGGGVMEYNLIEDCKTLLKNDTKKVLLKRLSHTGSRNGGSGMICSGEQSVALHYLNETNKSTINKIINCLSSNDSGTLHLNASSLDFKNQDSSSKFSYEVKNEHSWQFLEQLGYKETIYIVGSGHVGLATSKLFRELGFYVEVFDNRASLNTYEQNSYAHRKQVIDYDKVAQYIPEGDSSYIAIMTNKYTDDKRVLTKLIKKNYKFIGVLGSKAKIKTMFDVLLNEGFSQELLDGVNAPIGLEIRSQTPYEIAVGIAAKIIELKNRL